MSFAIAEPEFKKAEAARVESLESLLGLLEKAIEVDTSRSEFTEIFSFATRTLELDQESIARMLKISRPTVSRWETGASAPHPLGRPSVFVVLRDIARSKLAQHATTLSY